MQDRRCFVAVSLGKVFGFLLLLVIGLSACEVEENFRDDNNGKPGEDPNWRNECGGREPLDGLRNTPCGACGGGRMDCVDSDQLRCVDDMGCGNPELIVVEVRDVTTHSVTLVGELRSVGGYKEPVLGFCVAAGYEWRGHADGAHCFDVEMADSGGRFAGRVESELEGGTYYTGVAYMGQQPGASESVPFYYSQPMTFLTAPGVPQNLVATDRTESVHLSWDEVPGAAYYGIFRDGVSISGVDGSQTEFQDFGVGSGNGSTAPALKVENTPSAIALSWVIPEEFLGAGYTYQVVAQNSSGHQSEFSNEAVGHALNVPIRAVELQVWNGLSHEVVETFEVEEPGQTFRWSNSEAAAGGIAFQGLASATVGARLDHVYVQSGGVSIWGGAVNQYRLRAVGEQGWEAYSQHVQGQRMPGAPSYLWERRVSNTSYFSELVHCADQPECEDTTAASDGTMYDYRVLVGADGAESILSNTVHGARALLDLSFVAQPGGVETHTPFAVEVEVLNQFGVAFVDAPVTMTLLREGDLDFGETFGSQPTDVHGRARFMVQAALPRDDYRLEAGFGSQQLASSAVFDVKYGAVVLASESESGVDGDAAAMRPAVSGDGRYVVFASDAANLVDGVSGGQTQIYRKNLVDGSIVVVSANAAGVVGEQASSQAAVSGDGRYVVFSSAATNLVAGVSGSQVYCKDLVDGSVVAVSTSAAGVAGLGSSQSAAISADGRYVVFASSAANLVAGVSGGQIYRKDLVDGGLVLVSASKEGARGDGMSEKPSVSGDGRYVVFASESTNWVAGVVGAQVYRKDLVAGDVVLVSGSKNDVAGNAGSAEGAISADGRYVVFRSEATNLLVGVAGGGHIYRKDLEDGSLALVSVSALDRIADGVSRSPSISGDGRYVAFSSLATNLASGVNPGAYRIYRKDMQSGAVVVASASLAGLVSDAESDLSSISADGGYVGFQSGATNLLPGVRGVHVYVRRLAVL